MAALRVYLKQGDNRRATTWWGRMFEKPLSTHLVYAALEAEITHAAVSLGRIGYSKGAQSVSHDNSDMPLQTLPVCVELVAPKRILEQFIRDQRKHLAGTTLVMLEGVHISSLSLDDAEIAVGQYPHSVEYLSAGDSKIRVEHVEISDEAPAHVQIADRATARISDEAPTAKAKAKAANAD
jgi:PII-like signaling protein